MDTEINLEKCIHCGIIYGSPPIYTVHEANCLTLNNQTCNSRLSTIKVCTSLQQNVNVKETRSYSTDQISDNNLLCESCGNISIDVENFRIHQYSDCNAKSKPFVRPSKLFKCVYCACSFNLHTTLDNHIVSCHRCQTCNFIGLNSSELILHKANDHSISQIGSGIDSYLSVGPFNQIDNFRGFVKTYRQKNIKGEQNFLNYMNQIKPFVKAIVSNCLKELKSLKSQITVWCTFRRYIRENEYEIIQKPLNSHMQVVLNMNYFNEFFENSLLKIENTINVFQTYGSGWVFLDTMGADVRIGKYRPVKVGCFQSIPFEISKKSCVVNVRNNDNKCFMWAVLAALHSPPDRTQHSGRMGTYSRFINNYNFDNLNYPIEIKDLKIFESNNYVCVNVFYWDKEEGLIPFEISKNNYKVDFKTVNLLLLSNESGDHHHFSAIKNISSLLGHQNHHKRLLCFSCLQRFEKSTDMMSHLNICSKYMPAKIKMPKYSEEKGNPTIKFRNIHKQIKCGYVLYSDFESLPIPLNKKKILNVGNASGVFIGGELSQSMTRKVNTHVACGFSWTLIRKDGKMIKHRRYRDSEGVGNTIDLFLSEVSQISKIITSIYDNPKELINDPKIQYDLVHKTNCWICKGQFVDDDDDCKVVDHCHVLGSYRGIAHKSCNLLLQQKRELPVFIHNFRGYDSHLIIHGFKTFGDKFVVIPTNSEKYLSITVNDIIFLDSCQFLFASLDALVSNLKKEGLEKFDILKQIFDKKNYDIFKITGFTRFNLSESLDNLIFNPSYNASELVSEILSIDSINLLTRKGVYPYEYMDNFAKFKEKKLPKIESFKNSLKDTNISKEDYEHAQKVFRHFHCKNLGDYHDIYLTSDSLLLSCVFENFRNIALKAYGLDLVFYYSAPGFAFDAALKMSGVELEQFIDIKEYEFIESAMRGGISQISTRKAEANNKYMGSKYNENDEDKYIISLDMNNLYGCAMRQNLPTGGFNWLEGKEMDNFNIFSINESSTRGYILEVDLIYPQNLHDAHNDYPLACEKKSIPLNSLSEYQKSLAEILNIKYSEKQQKLVSHLGPRNKYITHYRNLKYYLEKGMKITKIHRILSFDQSPWLRAYIDFNTNMRKIAKSDFDRDFYKLLNNSVFGKTMENKRGRVNVRVVNDSKKALKLISKPTYKSHDILDENLCIFQLNPHTVTLDKPVYVGFCILELSKVFMYSFHYDSIKRWYGDNAKLLFTDTDSLCYLIKTHDLYTDLSNKTDFFDFSSYETSHPLYSTKNRKVLGKMHDEASGKIITSFVGLGSKAYSWIGIDISKKALKGIPKFIQNRDLSHEMYLKVLENQEKIFCYFKQIKSVKHDLGTYEITKSALHGFDSKRYILSDSFETLAFGHYLIK